MTLIELITYIGLLAIIMVGSVFSAYSMLFSEENSQVIMQISTQKL
jgi:hypothetical protein